MTSTDSRNVPAHDEHGRVHRRPAGGVALAARCGESTPTGQIERPVAIAVRGAAGRRSATRRPPTRPASQAPVLQELRSERFVDASPAQVWATLLDEGRYLCSERTMYRALAEKGEVRERRDQLTHPSYAWPELLAERPNELWSWYISKLLGPEKWTYFHLFVILDEDEDPMADPIAGQEGSCIENVEIGESIAARPVMIRKRPFPSRAWPVPAPANGDFGVVANSRTWCSAGTDPKMSREFGSSVDWVERESPRESSRPPSWRLKATGHIRGMH